LFFQAYLDHHAAQAEIRLKDKWLEQQSQLENLSRQQKTLEAKAKAIAKTQAECDRKNKEHREKVRRINNDKFERWLDNASWAVRTFWVDTRAMRWLILVHWLVLFPIVAILGLRVVVSDRCIESTPCRSVVSWIVHF
jgi:hypothetical protein